MFTFVLIIHIIVSLLLIVIVLMQQSSGGMGAMFGGGQDSVFGASGAGNLMTKITTVLAIVFMVTSLSLALVSKGASTAVEALPQVPYNQQIIPPVQNENTIPQSKETNIPVIPQGTSGETTE
ncbi:preprotein translocase subunit SecG [candidate division WOR-3 bacterium]|nr:preprotein translocase subunit SecG [candidate division WOR-3 bacterium]